MKAGGDGPVRAGGGHRGVRHTHYEMVDNHQGILMVNPGSPTLPRQLQRQGTVGLLELTAQGRSAQIIDLAKL